MFFSFYVAGAAPEVLRCEHHSRGSDVFSFGTILWELLSVSRAYEGLKQFEIIEKVCSIAVRKLIQWQQQQQQQY